MAERIPDTDEVLGSSPSTCTDPEKGLQSPPYPVWWLVQRRIDLGGDEDVPWNLRQAPPRRLFERRVRRDRRAARTAAEAADDADSDSRVVSFMVGIAQSGRAPGCGPGGRGFEARYSPQAVRMVVRLTYASRASVQFVRYTDTQCQVLLAKMRGYSQYNQATYSCEATARASVRRMRYADAQEVLQLEVLWQGGRCSACLRQSAESNASMRLL